MRTGPQTFEDPRAVAVASAVVMKLMEYARAMEVADLSLMRSGEVTDLIVVPTLELVNIICLFSGAPPPRPREVAELQQHHLPLLRRYAPELFGPELAGRRCAEVERVFTKLMLVADGYWLPREPPN